MACNAGRLEAAWGHEKDHALLSSALFTGFLYAGSAYAETEGGSKEVAPSAAEKRVIQNRINAVRNGQERAAIESQSAVWKMTTFLCQDAARAVLKKEDQGDGFSYRMTNLRVRFLWGRTF